MKATTLTRLINFGLWKYALAGAWRRARQIKSCPCCHAKQWSLADRKLFHSLLECANCRILYRYPNEGEESLSDFYQHDYEAHGFASEMPTEAQLKHLLETNFKGSEKDFSYHISILKALGLRPGNRVLDYGASWGYATYQFKQAGFVADGFEISRPRAEFGWRLGLDIHKQLPDCRRCYDAVYSCHVLEHVPNPLALTRGMLDWVKPGGLVAAHTPNGSLHWRQSNPKGFHSTWGQVHPFLLSDEFVVGNFGHLPCYVSSDDRPEVVGTWDKQTRFIGNVQGAGLFFALINAE
jgi:hypothetical protein